jgi:hypothetical protein
VIHVSSGSTNPVLSRDDDSIEEMASILLEDTTIDQLKPESGMRMSQIGTAKVLPDDPRVGSSDSKVLPQLPQLLFNGDAAWAMNTTPVVTAAGRTNETQFSSESAGQQLYPPTVFTHARKGSGPPIPRRSSKRKSRRPKNNISNPQPSGSGQKDVASSTVLSKIDISSRRPSTKKPESSPSQAADINSKIEAMMAATKALKPGTDGVVLQGPFVPTKKRRLRDNKVIAKMKTAFNDRLNSRSIRKRHDSARDDHLLDTSINEVNDFDDDVSVSVSALTALEIRMNEGEW